MDFFQSFHWDWGFLNFEAIFWVIFFFGGSIFVHELGHFLAAKKRKLFVPRFSIGFGPRIFSKTIGETEFCISLLPFGGYVAIPQLMAMKTIEGQYQIPETAKPISSADKIIVSAMGAVFNIIFAFILATILWKIGLRQAQSTTNNMVGYVLSEIKLPDGTKVTSPAKEAGIQIGDEIVAIDGREIYDYGDILHGIALGKNRDSRGPLSTITILRDGQRQDLIVHPVLVEQNQRSKESLRLIGIAPFEELVICEIYKNSPAERAGLQIGDKLYSIDGIRVRSHSQFNDLLKDSQNIQLVVERDGKQITVDLNLRLLPLTLPYIKLTTTDGVLEFFPFFGSKDSIENPCQNACELQLLSLSPEFQKNYPELHVESKITAIHGKPVRNFSDALFVFQNTIETPIELTIDGMAIRSTIKKVKFIPSENCSSFGVELQGTQVLCHKNPFEQIAYGARLIFLTLDSLISPSSDVHLKNLMGPPGIIKTLNTFATYDLRLLLWFVIILNINLAILNLLPIPVLDGGIIALVFLELFLRKKIAVKIIANLQLIFMLLFLGIAIYISFFDINRILGEKMMDEFMEAKQLKWQYLTTDEQLFWNLVKSE